MYEIKEIYDKNESLLDNEVEVKGWVKTIRNSKNFSFIHLNDGSCFDTLQIVFDKSVDNYDDIIKLISGAAIGVKGTLVQSLGKEQSLEIQAKEISIIGNCAEDFPVQKKRHTLEYLRTIAHLRPRTNTFLAVFRIRSLLAYAIHKFFNERNFVYVHTPIITGSDCEGAGEMFKVSTLDFANMPFTQDGAVDYNKDFFGKETNLTVSGQLAVENFCMSHRKVYTFGPTFRAENSNTQRHASEFWMVEPEIAFADLKDDMSLAEDMLKSIFSYVLEKAPKEMKFFNSFIEKGVIDKIEKLINSEFARITYTEAIDILSKSKEKFDFKPEWGCDLQTEHERFLSEKVFKKALFVTDYPKEIKAFYMKLNDDNKTVAAMDLLVPSVGEIIGGSQREDNYDVLVNKIKNSGMNVDDYWWYLDLRKYGSVPHAGFGLGFERAIMYLTGISNIRDVVPFPRTPRSADF